MTRLSVGKAWEEGMAFVGRESALLLPVAMLFIAVPAFAGQVMMPPELVAWIENGGKGAMPDVPASFWLLALVANIVELFGALGLLALALRPGISVGEALRLAMTRAPILIGAFLLFSALVAGVVLVAALVVGVLAAASATLAYGLAALMVVAAVAGSVILTGRLIMLYPVVVDTALGVRDSLRASWRMTAGNVLRLLGFLIAIVVLSFIVSGAAQLVSGVLFGLMMDADVARTAAMGVGLVVSTVILVYMLATLARLYRQLQPAEA